MKLTVKQRKFCDEYLKSGNATQAYRNAGYSANTDSVASSEAWKLLRKPKVQAYLNEHMDKMHEKGIASAEDVLKYLTRVVMGKETEYVTTPGGVIPNVPVSAKDRINAGKEILKRFPSDRLSLAQIRKTEADADLTEAKVKAMKDLTGEDNAKLNQLLDAVTGGVDKDENSNK